MGGPSSRNRIVVAGLAVVMTAALAAAIVSPAYRVAVADASHAPSASTRLLPRPPVLSSPSTATARPSGSRSPSEDISATEFTQTFLSPIFRYAIRYPLSWRPEGSASEHDADTFTATASTGTRLSILRRARTPDVPFEDQAKSWLPPRHQSTGGCFWSGGGLLYVAGGDVFHEDAIDRHPALIRSECSVVDAAVDLGDEMLLLVLRSSRHMATGDRATFDDFAATLAIKIGGDGPIPTPHPQRSRPPETPQPTQAVMFVSTRFGYAIAHPFDWRVDEVTTGLEHDELKGPAAQRLSIRTVTKPTSMSVRAWAEANLATRVTMSDPWTTGCHWPGGTVFIPRQPARFANATIAGKQAVVRSECSDVDGVVDLGDRVLVLSLRFTAHRADGDRPAFDGLVDGLRILTVR